MSLGVAFAQVGGGHPAEGGDALLAAIVAGAVLAAAAVASRRVWPARRLAVGLAAAACLPSGLALWMFLVLHARPGDANAVIVVPVLSMAAAAYAVGRPAAPRPAPTRVAPAPPAGAPARVVPFPLGRSPQDRCTLVVLGLVGIALLWVPRTSTTTDQYGTRVVTTHGILGWAGSSEIRRDGYPPGVGGYGDPFAFVLSVGLTVVIAWFAVIRPVTRMIWSSRQRYDEGEGNGDTGQVRIG